MNWVVALIVLAGGLDELKEVTFAKSDAGKVPAGWSVARTGKGEGSAWSVTPDESTPSKAGYALAQTASGPGALFNLCVLDGSSFKDGELSVLVKAVSGKIDQGGGVMWRYKDADNYYICRYNPLEENFRLYHVKAGKRTQLATKEDVAVPDGKWFTVSVKHSGNKIECSLDGTKHLVATDDTFPDAGKVGLWTKADAKSHFDKFRYTAGK